MVFGLALYAASFAMMDHQGPDWGFAELLVPQAVRGVAVLFTMVPVFGAALRDMPDVELRDASGLANLMRNLGGAVGIAAANTWLGVFAAAHLLRLDEALGLHRGAAVQAVRSLALRLGAEGAGLSRARTEALARLAAGLQRQALSLAFDDVYRALTIVFAAALLLVPFCRGGPMSRRTADGR
jgi:DHA2 family multidrug resistance protein